MSHEPEEVREERSTNHARRVSEGAREAACVDILVDPQRRLVSESEEQVRERGRAASVGSGRNRMGADVPKPFEHIILRRHAERRQRSGLSCHDPLALFLSLSLRERSFLDE